MINSRDLHELLPRVQAKCVEFIAACKAEGIDVLITSTYRDNESQGALYAQGRTTPGKIVTNAAAGMSFHNYRVAFDFVPLVNGKAIWDDKALWDKCGAIGQQVGLEWGGSWKFKDKPHMQDTDNLTIEDYYGLAGNT